MQGFDEALFQKKKKALMRQSSTKWREFGNGNKAACGRFTENMCHMTVEPLDWEFQLPVALSGVLA